MSQLSALRLVIVQEATGSVNALRRCVVLQFQSEVLPAVVFSGAGRFDDLFFRGAEKICVEIGVSVGAIIVAIGCCELGRSFRVGAVRLLIDGPLVDGARSPSGKAKVCKTFIGGSIPPRASNFFLLHFQSPLCLVANHSKIQDMTCKNACPTEPCATALRNPG
jgi:hypothetical protein